jgi:hypothetical protein
MGILITADYLRTHPNEIFVFGDNTLRKGHKGAAELRDFKNTYGFITKIYPSGANEAFYTPETYKEVLDEEINKLECEIAYTPGKTYLITELGGGLANRFNIRPMIIKATERLKKYPNVRFI